MAISKQSDFNGGFTLVEILVTAGILLVLGALAVPAVGRVLSIRGDMACVSNLRQIGLGILNYTQDNHGVLPGPLQAMQYTWWPGMGPGKVNGGDPSQLASYVLPYLELKKIRTAAKGYDVFLCPAFKRAVQAIGFTPVYAVNIRVPMGEELQEYPPFGYPGDSFPETFNSDEIFPPLRLVNLSEIRDANGSAAQTSTWLMMDADQENERFKKEDWDLSALTPKKVHDNHRNALFFDFHVAKVDYDTNSQP
jgi:prepilin-type processing-associated H-X9-DG protein